MAVLSRFLEPTPPDILSIIVLWFKVKSFHKNNQGCLKCTKPIPGIDTTRYFAMDSIILDKIHSNTKWYQTYLLAIVIEASIEMWDTPPWDKKRI